MQELNVKQTTACYNGGFRMDGYWVWGGRPVKDDDGVYHLFAARWSNEYPMHPGWLFHSEIVRAESTNLEGPYEFKELVFERRDRSFFDGMSQHNPTIHFFNGKYYLFYIGTSYDEDAPTVENHPQHGDDWYHEVWNKKRIGVAVADSPRGPWKRPDKPILLPRPDNWDQTITSNPAVAILEDGTTYLMYKSSKLKAGGCGPFFLGGAKAPAPEGPFERVKDEPLFSWPEEDDKHVEDPFIWHDGDHFHVIMKDMTGKICGEHHSGIHASSPDFINWTIDEGTVAYSRTVTLEDGRTVNMGQLERPQGYFIDGKLAYVFFATADGAGGFDNADSTWNMPVKFE